MISLDKSNIPFLRFWRQHLLYRASSDEITSLGRVSAQGVLGFPESWHFLIVFQTPNLGANPPTVKPPPFFLHFSVVHHPPTSLSTHHLLQHPGPCPPRGNRDPPSSLAPRIKLASQHAMGTTSIVTEADLDDEAVALVRLPPSPTIEPSTPSPLSTLTSLSSPRPQTTTTTPSVHTPVPAPASSSSQSLVSSRLDDRAAVAAAAATTSAIPTPKSTTASDTPPPPTSQSGERPRGNPQVTDNCMFCTPETAPPVENLEWIQCNGCKRWAHTQCTGLPRSINIQTIDKFHCKRCEKTRGPTTCNPHPLLFNRRM